MKKVDNFNPGQWLIENKLTNQSKLIEMKINDPTTSAIKSYILQYFKYNDDEFESNYDADSDVNDYVDDGEFVQSIPFNDNDTPDDFYEKLVKMIKEDPDTKHNTWRDVYQKTWVLKTYPFEDSGENWTEYLHVDIQIPKNETDINIIFFSGYEQDIEIIRTVPFNEDMKRWWIANYGEN
jgi:hypothetical protein